MIVRVSIDFEQNIDTRFNKSECNIEILRAFTITVPTKEKTPNGYITSNNNKYKLNLLNK